MVKKEHSVNMQIPQDIDIEIADNRVKVKGIKGQIERVFASPRIKIFRENNNVIIRCKEGLKFLQNDKMMINTIRAHIRNAFSGVTHGYDAKLKICSGHFPMSVSVSSDKLSIKNFLGEKVPRTTNIIGSTKVEVKGDEIYVSGLDKDLVGQMAAKIEQLTRITNKDRRVFQDGCFIIKKPTGSYK